MKAFSTPDFVDLLDHEVIPEHARASISKEMYEVFVQTLGPEKAYKICRVCLERPNLTIRANTLKTTRKELLSTLTKDYGHHLVPCKYSPNGLRFIRPPVESLFLHAEFKRGHFEIQDEAS